MQKKLLLINPLSTRRNNLIVSDKSLYPPLALGILAALTPADWDIRIMDENFEDYSFEEADLVGITAFTSSAHRAYQIARNYRDRNIPVVMGGIHASMLPEEAGKYVDTVVVGEAEGIWTNILYDFDQNQLRPRYEGKRLPLKEAPIPRHDLFHPSYQFDSIQTTRGCPHNCAFCTVPVYNGNIYRARPVASVLEELSQITAPNLFFIDDNIVGYSKRSHQHAKDIFKGMVDNGLQKDFFCQASINFGDDEELLELAAAAGCRMVFIGVESENTETLKSINKRSNLKTGVDNYSKTFAKIQKYGISVLGAFILGLETDDLEAVEKRIDYIMNSNVDAVQLSILTPSPGTETYRKFSEDGRIIANDYPRDWDRYWGFDVVIDPYYMKAEDLLKAARKGADRIYDEKRILHKLLATRKLTNSNHSAAWAFATNENYKLYTSTKPQYQYTTQQYEPHKKK